MGSNNNDAIAAQSRGAPPADTGEASALTVDLRQAVYALSDALDLVGIDDVGHGKRVGVMAAACAQVLGLDPARQRFLFDLGMLHDIGVSSTSTHNHLVSEFDWKGSQAHCEIGYALLRRFAPLSDMALPIRYHHTHWSVLSTRTDIDPAVARQANLIFLVDRVDALAAPHYADRTLLMETAGIRERIASERVERFAPELVDAFLAASATQAFWLQLEPRGLQSVMQDMLAGHAPCSASFAELRQLAVMFSRIVDAKSPFTAAHSLGVSNLSRFVAQRMGVGRANCDKIEIAGLLHDLGKLRIPDEILDKPAALDERERKVIESHSFETFQILRHIEGFEEITEWAASHHEDPDGTGYPFHRRNLELPLEARILRAADIFQAMVQDRPYRKGFSADRVLDFMRNLGAKGSVEQAIVDVFASDIHGAMAAALPRVAEPAT